MNPSWVVLRFIVLGLAVTLVQVIISGVLPEFIANPNLLLGLVIFLAFHEATPLSAFLVFGLGLIMDLAGGLILGPWAGAYCLVFAAIASVSQRVFIESYASTAFAAFFASLLTSTLVLMLTGVLTTRGWSSLTTLLSEACLTALLAPMVVACARGWLSGGGKLGAKRGTRAFERF
ncbi:MAG: rod shape-determining protein MreD [Bdellovibrionota bacterium]|nr:MAG: rod shape-determining protein MreD [Bdellovibrionota bacterium]